MLKQRKLIRPHIWSAWPWPDIWVSDGVSLSVPEMACRGRTWMAFPCVGTCSQCPCGLFRFLMWFH